MGEIDGAVNKPQGDMSSLQKQQGVSKDSIKEKRLPVLISALLSFIGGYFLNYLSTNDPHIVMIIRPPFPQFNQSRVMHIFTIKNDSKKLAEEIELTIKGIKNKNHVRRISGNPPISSCNDIYSNDGALSLKCGELKPKGIITISLEYDNPPITINDIELYAKNAISRKIDSNQLLESK